MRMNATMHDIDGHPTAYVPVWPCKSAGPFDKHGVPSPPSDGLWPTSAHLLLLARQHRRLLASGRKQLAAKTPLRLPGCMRPGGLHRCHSTCLAAPGVEVLPAERRRHCSLRLTFLHATDEQLDAHQEPLRGRYVVEDKGQLPAHELDDDNVLRIGERQRRYGHRAGEAPGAVPVVVVLDYPVDLGHRAERELDDAAAPLIHLQGLQVLQNLAVDVRVVLTGRQLRHVHSLVQLQDKLLVSAQELLLDPLVRVVAGATRRDRVSPHVRQPDPVLEVTLPGRDR
mmetsp:Transcript_98735/g.288008  ORF Transcript_98735/g.288008 Transcript_98735/m.288008 type:complete len:283 (+) Transcript_98735:210-1058(+)